MTSLLFGIILSALLSTTSLLIVLFRVSPLSAPLQALPAFFVSLFLTISSVGALFFFLLWRVLPIHTWDAGKTLGISVRQGILLASATAITIFFHLLHILTWWIAVLIYTIFVLVELALNA
ncbi:hypothetical protein HY285_05895 [Candidatus Peregrinibacteria bacterium]|nr:hypothetical protein [Candidatus Peregrinibacteria bacterium]MBI3817038.1 hypothetical protein [Candidatus Peregrinibacteria bacterium]